jgi:cytochrome oxidase Cu insertion factor (SCO1/SenC/PrrC family)
LHPLRFALIALACLALGGLGGLIVAMVSKPTPAPARFLPPPTAPPEFTLHDQNGRAISPADARGKVLVMTFLYSTCRTLCPAQAQEIRNAVGLAGAKDVEVYGVSVDPVGDTPLNARRFLRRAGLVDPRVHFLLGSRRELSAVWRSYGIVPINATPDEARAAAAAYDWQHGPGVKAGADAAEYEHCPGGAAGYEQYEAAEQSGEEEEEDEEGCEEDEPPPAAEEPYPDTADGAYRGHPRHGSWDFEHTAYVLVIDKHGRQRIGFPFEQLTAERLADDIRALSAGSD